MADNVGITPGSGVEVASDEITIGGVLVQVQRVKAGLGGDGVYADPPGDAAFGADVDVTRSVLPTGAATEATLDLLTQEGAPITGQTLEAGGSHELGWLSSIRKAITATLTISGTVTANLGTIAGVATDTVLQAVRDRLPAALVGGRLDVNVGNIAGGGLVSGTTSLTTTASIQLSAGQSCKAVAVQNDPDNVQDILVGDSLGQVYQLVPGQGISLPVSNVNLVYAKNVVSATQPVNWLAIT